LSCSIDLEKYTIDYGDILRSETSTLDEDILTGSILKAMKSGTVDTEEHGLMM